MKFWAVLPVGGALLLMTLGMGTVAHAAGELRAEGDYFRDRQDRKVFLRGVNVSGDVKTPPFAPPRPETLDPLPGWGFNTIRLLFIWEAYEPEPGHYNEAYLDRLVALADGAWARGLYVIIDFHEDDFSHYVSTGCGEGFPAWAVASRVRNPQPKYVPGGCSPMWGVVGMLSTDMHRAYHDFYAGVEGGRAGFLAVWARLARRFHGHPGVIGYDILNEPWGNELNELAPLYRDAARVIRAEDPEAILFVEPLVFLVTFGFKPSWLPRFDFGNFAYAPHFYDPFSNGSQGWEHWRSGVTRHAFRTMTAKAHWLGAPLFVGEFGSWPGSRNATAFSDYQYDQFGQRFVSGAQWNFTPGWTPEHLDGWNREDTSIVGADGKLRNNFRPHPYVERLAGTPLRQHETRDTLGGFTGYELDWVSEIGGETEVYVPAGVLADPAHFSVKWSGTECVVAADRVRCRSLTEGVAILKVSRL